MKGNRNLLDRFAAFMTGRNGFDDCARAMFGFAVCAMVLQYATGFFSGAVSSLFSCLSTALFLYALFRMLSRNIVARQRENRGWIKVWTPILVTFRRKYSRFKEWKAHHREFHIDVCKQCGQTLKVPKGKGRIRVTCPKCRSVYERKS